jgi:hypothetical protein
MGDPRISADMVGSSQTLKRSCGFAHLLRPTYAPRHAGAGWANVGHPSRTVDCGREIKLAEIRNLVWTSGPKGRMILLG